jgi:hypothetical protein
MKRISIIAGCLLAAHAASAGVYVETIKHTISTGATEPQQKMYVQNGSGRFVDPAGHTTLIKNNTLYILDDANQSYIVFDKETMEAVAKKISDSMERMKQQLAKLPPEQRAQLEQRMGGLTGASGAAHTVEVANMGKSETVGGRPCKIWNVARDGELDEQICVVAYSALPGKENFQALFASFSNVFEEMAKSVPTLSGVMANEFSAQVKVGGFPVRQRSYEDGKLGDEETLVKEWREEAFPASMFEIPAGYKQKQMPMGPGM